MNMVREKGNLKHELRNKIRQLWSDLSDSEVALYEGQRDAFFKAVQKKYGLHKVYAEGVLRELEEQFYHAA